MPAPISGLIKGLITGLVTGLIRGLNRVLIADLIVQAGSDEVTDVILGTQLVIGPG